MLRSCLVSSLFWLLLLRLDCRLLQAIEKKEKLSIAASKIDIYSSKESFSCFNDSHSVSTDCGIVFWQFARDRMESGLGKMKKHQ